MKKSISLLLCISMIFALSLGFTTNSFAEKAIDSGDIVVLYTNDVHCNVSATANTMGLADVAGYKAYVSSLTDQVSLVDNGDFIQGAPIGTLSNGEMLTDIMNSTGYDICIYGNHEFDYRMTQLKNLVARSSAKYISCNFMDLKTGKTVSDPYTIVNYGGIKIAYVGICTPKMITSSTPKYFQDSNGNYIYGFCQDTTGQKLYTTVQNTVNDAKSHGADYVIAMSHLGLGLESNIYSSTNLIKNTYGIDVVLDGHSHSVIEGETVKNKNNDDVTLTSTGTKLANLGQLVIDTNSTASKDDDTLKTQLLSADKLTGAYQNSAYAATENLVESKVSELSGILGKTVANSSVELTINKADGTRGVRDRETNLGDFVCDAYRIVMDADIGIVNGGGIRANISAGTVTNGDIISVHPYGNAMCVVKATGREIIDALEFGARKAAADPIDPVSGKVVDENGGWLQVSGISYCVNLMLPSSAQTDADGMFSGITGEYRVSNVLVLDKATGLYLPIDLDKEYTVASSSYVLKNSGDGNNIFKDNELIQDESMLDNQCLIAYITDYLHGSITNEYENIAGQGRIKTLSASHDTCTFGDWIIVTAATKDHDGTMIRYCSVCNKYETKTYKYDDSGKKPTDDGKDTDKDTTSKKDTTKESPDTGYSSDAFLIFITLLSGAGVIQFFFMKRKSQIKRSAEKGSAK